MDTGAVEVNTERRGMLLRGCCHYGARRGKDIAVPPVDRSGARRQDGRAPPGWGVMRVRLPGNYEPSRNSKTPRQSSVSSRPYLTLEATMPLESTVT